MTERRKAIPESRDRLQSRLLVGLTVPALALTTIGALLISLGHRNPRSDLYVWKALGVSLTFALLVWGVRSATSAAAICGSMICFLVTTLTGRMSESIWRSGLAPLAATFVLTFAATKAGKHRKVRLGVAEDKRGRNAAQVIANLGMAALVALAGFAGAFDRIAREFPASLLITPTLLAALCEATADTVSSEIGQAFGGPPVMLTTFRRVDPGTDGAVSLLGTVAGIAAAALVALVGMWAMQLPLGFTLLAFVGGVAGLFFDSLLGATVERKGWLGNDLVNFSSTAFAALTALALLIALQLLSHR